MPMDEIIPSLWISDITSAQNVEELKSKGIFSILTAMRGRVRINETFTRHQILLDDTEDSDILSHFLPSITFIQAELDKGRGVLVHCQAGMSRSAAIVAAYLMYTRKMDLDSALELIRESRPMADPNPSFLEQLQVFHEAAFNVSGKSQAARRYYMNRTVGEVMNGDGTYDSSEFFPPEPPSKASSVSEKIPRRRIRCKMCRHELAAREHMLDHGQLGNPTPAVSRRPSTSMHGDGPRRKGVGIGGSGLAMSSVASQPPRQNILNSFGMSSMLTSDQDDSAVDSGSEDDDDHQGKLKAAQQLGRKLSEAMRGSPHPEKAGDSKDEILESTHFCPNELSERLNSDSSLEDEIVTISVETPKPISPQTLVPPSSVMLGQIADEISPPILKNKNCSGYFLEPMKWMDSFLSSGELAGKIPCPNAKCNAKLGNYDWAGVKCGCGQWVVPGFCISRSKVDEVVR